MTTILFLSLAACALAQRPVEVARHPVTIDQVPAAARTTLERQAKGRPLRKLAQVDLSNGCAQYDGRVKQRWLPAYDVTVAPSGELIGRWRHEEPEGSGP